jgi:hypothetical protein
MVTQPDAVHGSSNDPMIRGTPIPPALLPQCQPDNEATTMICPFCQQDVNDPCHDRQELRQRAMSHVDRCERALKDDLSDGINPSDGQSAGSI